MKHHIYVFVGVAVLLFIIAAGTWLLSRPGAHLEVHVGPAAKADKLPVPVSVREIPLAKPIKTESIKLAVSDQAEKPPIGAETAASAPKTPEALPLASHETAPTAMPSQPRVPRPVLADICARSGGYKQITHHGRSWHCVYSRR